MVASVSFSSFFGIQTVTSLGSGWYVALAFALAVFLSACDRNTTTIPDPVLTREGTQNSLIGVTPLEDSIMGRLSPVALAVVAGLGDPQIRHDLIAYMRTPTARGEVDLSKCLDDGVVSQLFASAASRLGVGVSGLCSPLQGRRAILYMNPYVLSTWDESVIPLVAAVDNPGHRLPATIQVYRSPFHSVAIPSGGKANPFVLYVLPYSHPNNLNNTSRLPTSTRQSFGPDSIPAFGSRASSPLSR